MSELEKAVGHETPDLDARDSEAIGSKPSNAKRNFIAESIRSYKKKQRLSKQTRRYSKMYG